MGPKALFSSIICLFCVATLASPSTFLFDNIFNQAEAFRGRTLLEEEPLKPCPIDFKNKNYTDITIQCKGTDNPEGCCKAFKQLACPYVDYINDRSTNCTYSLIYYITLYVHYPFGLYYNKCIEGPIGIDCTGQ